MQLKHKTLISVIEKENLLYEFILLLGRPRFMSVVIFRGPSNIFARSSYVLLKINFIWGQG